MNFACIGSFLSTLKGNNIPFAEPVFDGVRVAHSFSLFLSWSPMLSVCLMVTLFSFYDGVRVVHVLSLFVLELFTNVVCVFWVHPSQLLMGSMLLIFFSWSWVVHQCCLCLLSSSSIKSNSVSVVHFVLLLFVFTFFVPSCEVRYDFQHFYFVHQEEGNSAFMF